MERKIEDGLRAIYGNKQINCLFEAFAKKEGLFEYIIKKVKQYKRLPRKLKKRIKKRIIKSF